MVTPYVSAILLTQIPAVAAWVLTWHVSPQGYL